MDIKEIEEQLRAMKRAGQFRREDGARYVSSFPDDNGFDIEAAQRLNDEIFADVKAVGDGLPQIVITGRPLHEKTADAMRALVQTNDPPRIFRHGGGLARVEINETGQPIIQALNEAAVRGELERAADWYKTAPDGLTHTAPPMDVVRDFVTVPGGWPEITTIHGVTENPVIRPDGSIFDVKGYDSATHLYYYPATDTLIPQIPAKPGREEVLAASALLFELFCDFPFDSPASQTNVKAALISPVVRPLVAGPTPLCVIDKPQVGSGASLIASVISRATTGRPAAMMNAPHDPDEWRKTIISLLLEGRGIIIIDNVDGSLYDANLAAVLTATVYSARGLGGLEQKNLPNLATWIATGNNVKLGGDLPRRAYLVRIDVGVARPWEGEPNSFKHPELETWTTKNRGLILAAILTLARAWIVAGRPQPADLPRLGGYESWIRVVGGILHNAGITGFLSNLAEMYDRNDAEMPVWAAFVAVWFKIFGNKSVTGVDILRALSDDKEFESTLPMDPPSRNSQSGKVEDSSFTRKLGKALSAREGRIYRAENTEYKLVRGGTSHSAQLWRILQKDGKGEFAGVETPPF